MLPAFVIGLREGLETVVVIGAIVLFLRSQGRRDLLPRVWRATALAAAVTIAIGFVIRFVEVNLPWRQQERFETVVGVAAVVMVTYMVVWMRRFPKDLQVESNAAAASALARDSGRAIVALAFFAVLREGFEIAVFVVATIGLTGRSAWLSTGGAFLGVAAALVLGVGVVKGSRHLDVKRFFRVTALVLVLSAAGIAMSTVHSANAAGWITFGQKPQFDLSWLAPPGSILSSFTTGMLGLQPYPVIIEVVAWFAYLVPMTAVVLWPRRTAKGRRPLRRLRWVVPGVVLVALAGGAGAYAATTAATTPSSAEHSTAKPKVLFATLDDVTCPGAGRCLAVGDYLPVDKDAARGDPDGDGQATHTLAESFGSGRWSVIRTPDPGRGGAALSALSCPTRSQCVAVGYYRPAPFPLQAKSAPPTYPLVEEYDGRGWQIVPSPGVAPNTVLSGVSCPTPSSCVAVGYTTTAVQAGNAVESLLVEDFDAGSWSRIPISTPPGTSSGLSSVSCPTIASCVAVGNMASVSDLTTTHPLIETSSGGTWSSVPLATYDDAPGILYGVQCLSAGHCVAVGNTQALRSSGSALVLTSAGSAWTGDVADLDEPGDVTLTTLSCSSTTQCVVAGSSWESPFRILARIDGPGWQELTVSPVTANLDGVTCGSQSQCLVVGSVPQNTFGNTTALLASVAGAHWKVDRGPAP